MLPEEREGGIRLMETRLLRAFVVVAQTGTISAAADLLGYSQSTLSRQLVALEKELGCVLFARDTKPMTLTRAGQERLAAAQQMLDIEQRIRV